MIRVIRNYGSHDPMNSLVPGATWFSALDALPHPELDTILDQALLLRELQAAPEPPSQHNHHVMAYWSWRLDGLANGLIMQMRRAP